MQEAYRLAPGDAVLQKTPFSFDVSVWELFWPLMAGARLVVAAPGGHRDPPTLSGPSIAREHHVAALRAVDAARVPDEHVPGVCRALRRVICSGEALPPDLVDACPRAAAGDAAQSLRSDRGGGRRHLTGPARAGEHARARSAGPSPTRSSTSSMRALEPVPIGVPGELYIGGVGSAAATIASARAHGRTFPAGSVRFRLGGPPLQDGRSLPAPGGRYHRVSGAPRSPGQNPRIPHRARRDRDCARRADDDSRSGRHGQGRCSGRHTARGLRRRL